MANHRTLIYSAAAAGTLICASIVGFLCWPGQEPPPPQPAVEALAPAPVVAAKPAVTPVAQLMKEYGISNKIRLAEDKAPATDVERLAVLKFFDAFAKSNPDAIKGAMSPDDRSVLEAMHRSGAFQASTAGVDSIRLATGQVSGKPYVVAVFVTGSLYEPQLWAYNVDGEARNITSQQFESFAQLVNMQSRFSGTNLIADWIKIIEAERAESMKADEVLEQVVRTQKAEVADDSNDATNSSGNKPFKGRRAPPAKPLTPPDFKPGGVLS